MKAAQLTGLAGLSSLRSVPSPALSGSGSIREGEPAAYVKSVADLLAQIPTGPPVGLACQRSTFTLWDRVSGETQTPLISWQDSRAEPWCAKHAAFANTVTEVSGLRMSPHYAGPKLAYLISQNQSLARGLAEGSILFGTLDCFLIWLATGRHEIDLTMAARTTLFNIHRERWSDRVLDRMQIPSRALPNVVHTRRREAHQFHGHSLRASIADQAASVLTTLPNDPSFALVSLGTGGFVMRPAPLNQVAAEGYLTAPVLSEAGRQTRHVWEGTINGVGATLDAFPRSAAPLPERDPTPDAFCIPDSAGLGAPDWLPHVRLTWSTAASALDVQAQRRIAVEGLLFRIRQLLEGLFFGGRPKEIRVTGGPSHDPALQSGLAALFGTRVKRVELTDAGLVGIARIAAAESPFVELETASLTTSSAGSYLDDKYERWMRWYREICAEQ